MSINTFDTFNLLPSILEQVNSRGYVTPTPIQEKSIGAILDKRDLLGIAKTGSGKTAAFSLPLIDNLSRGDKEVSKNHVRTLILTPTRELASQIEENIEVYGKGLGLKSHVVFGGVSKNVQIDAINEGLDIVVATPGRLLDIYDSGFINFSELEVFILDEADMMLDMGFNDDVRRIISYLPEKRQTLMFSATMPEEIEMLSLEILENPERVEVNVESTVASEIEQKFYAVEKANKGYLLNSLLEKEEVSKVLLFCKTKYGAEIIIEHLNRSGIPSATIHSKKTQGAREEALRAFKDGELKVLVATDIAARGIDVKDISHVINYNLPEDPKSYVHRIGRTGRAQKNGVAISFCVEADVTTIKNIGKITKQQIEFDKDQPFHKDFSMSSKKKGSKNKKGKSKKKR